MESSKCREEEHLSLLQMELLTSVKFDHSKKLVDYYIITNDDSINIPCEGLMNIVDASKQHLLLSQDPYSLCQAQELLSSTSHEIC